LFSVKSMKGRESAQSLLKASVVDRGAESDLKGCLAQNDCSALLVAVVFDSIGRMRAARRTKVCIQVSLCVRRGQDSCYKEKVVVHEKTRRDLELGGREISTLETDRRSVGFAIIRASTSTIISRDYLQSPFLFDAHLALIHSLGS
jgi:hypothetical protein